MQDVGYGAKEVTSFNKGFNESAATEQTLERQKKELVSVAAAVMYLRLIYLLSLLRRPLTCKFISSFLTFPVFTIGMSCCTFPGKIFDYCHD
jgi:hypothetical protein